VTVPGIAFTGDEALHAPLEAALREVIDPEMSVNIVDLGLVYAVHASRAGVRVRITMTSAACPVADLIIEHIVNALEGVVGGNVAVDVDLVWEPAWSPERMSPRARALMGWD